MNINILMYCNHLNYDLKIKTNLGWETFGDHGRLDCQSSQKHKQEKTNTVVRHQELPKETSLAFKNWV